MALLQNVKPGVQRSFVNATRVDRSTREGLIENIQRRVREGITGRTPLMSFAAVSGIGIERTRKLDIYLSVNVANSTLSLMLDLGMDLSALISVEDQERIVGLQTELSETPRTRIELTKIMPDYHEPTGRTVVSVFLELMNLEKMNETHMARKINQLLNKFEEINRAFRTVKPVKGILSAATFSSFILHETET